MCLIFKLIQFPITETYLAWWPLISQFQHIGYFKIFTCIFNTESLLSKIIVFVGHSCNFSHKFQWEFLRKTVFFFTWWFSSPRPVSNTTNRLCYELDGKFLLALVTRLDSFAAYHIAHDQCLFKYSGKCTKNIIHSDNCHRKKYKQIITTWE